jgi:NAD(P)-dependent dehydrogenase (short-subunit alcohol dehydrogenase family)
MDHPGSEPEEQAYPLVFLVSDAASFINGHCLVVDLGFTAGGTVGAVESPFLSMLLE